MVQELSSEQMIRAGIVGRERGLVFSKTTVNPYLLEKLIGWELASLLVARYYDTKHEQTGYTKPETDFWGNPVTRHYHKLLTLTKLWFLIYVNLTPFSSQAEGVSSNKLVKRAIADIFCFPCLD